MQILLDTSFLYALNDADDRNHVRAVNFARGLKAELLLSTSVLPELCYLLHSRLGHLAMRRFLEGLAQSDITLLPLVASDMFRITELLATYADARLDFTDTAIIATAERLGIEQVATFDHRDFSLVHPQHCVAFEVLP